VVCTQPAAHAGLAWDWSFGGTESGTIYTDGTLADALGAHTFTITTFRVTTSSVPTLVGAGFTETQPAQGFLWGGTTITQFFRLSGVYTNGSNFFADAYYYSLYANSSVVQAGLKSDAPGVVIDYTSRSVGAPYSTTATPEPGAAVMARRRVVGRR
jgi:hypothetical protein